MTLSGFEPERLSTWDFKSHASANSAIGPGDYFCHLFLKRRPALAQESNISEDILFLLKRSMNSGVSWEFTVTILRLGFANTIQSVFIFFLLNVIAIGVGFEPTDLPAHQFSRLLAYNRLHTLSDPQGRMCAYDVSSVEVLQTSAVATGPPADNWSSRIRTRDTLDISQVL